MQVRARPGEYWASANGSTLSADIPTGDAYAPRGTAPWIAEMYGYAFAAAEAGVSHTFPPDLVAYPRDLRAALGERGSPAVLHYGIDFQIGTAYSWNKMVFGDFDPAMCPPGGLFFGTPPSAHLVASQGARWHGGAQHGAFVVRVLNAGLCRFYRRLCAGMAQVTCPPDERDEELPLRCPPDPAARPPCCEDADAKCWQWGMAGECTRNAAFMRASCARTCGACPPGTVGAAAAIRAAAARGEGSGGADGPAAHRRAAPAPAQLAGGAAAGLITVGAAAERPQPTPPQSGPQSGPRHVLARRIGRGLSRFVPGATRAADLSVLRGHALALALGAACALLGLCALAAALACRVGGGRHGSTRRPGGVEATSRGTGDGARGGAGGGARAAQLSGCAGTTPRRGPYRGCSSGGSL